MRFQYKEWLALRNRLAVASFKFTFLNISKRYFFKPFQCLDITQVPSESHDTGNENVEDSVCQNKYFLK